MVTTIFNQIRYQILPINDNTTDSNTFPAVPGIFQRPFLLVVPLKDTKSNKVTVFACSDFRKLFFYHFSEQVVSVISITVSFSCYFQRQATHDHHDHAAVNLYPHVRISQVRNEIREENILLVSRLFFINTLTLLV